ncbi:predicted protein [Neisseria gonorrhoeae SK-93-1035]|nr:predicted protein [Neisseria gonorrhoeae SK-93-1035]KAE9495134.1 hypothetical protein F9Z35_2092 [Neisseria gonorrhoeae]KMY26034.1 hypothetical protein NGDG_01596 [Neisseria gonorrhoeae FA6140]KAE9498300.1 hypothetical protein F9Z37_2135 [Neisseria gonorrhoeae]KAE9500457.1 hypothetical protein F9Z38_1224 [Neisseria gonorrhoeae]
MLQTTPVCIPDGGGFLGRTPEHAGMDRLGAGYGGRVDVGVEAVNPQKINEMPSEKLFSDGIFVSVHPQHSTTRTDTGTAFFRSVAASPASEVSL